MTISSRTPEGDPNRCPICGVNVRIEKSMIGNDAPCPQCGCLLFFDSSEVLFATPTKEFLKSLEPLSPETFNRLDSALLKRWRVMVLGLYEDQIVLGLESPDREKIDALKQHFLDETLVVRISEAFMSRHFRRRRRRIARTRSD